MGAVEVFQRHRQIPLREASADDFTRRGLKEAKFGFRVGSVTLVGAAAIEEDRLHDGAELFHTATRESTERVFQVSSSNGWMRAWCWRGRRFLQQLQPRFELFDLRISGFELGRSLQLVGTLLVE